MDYTHPVPAHSDARGEIIDILQEDVDSVTMVTMVPNSVRGNHYHKQTTQWNYVLDGSVRYKTDKGEVTLSPGDFVRTEPNTPHALKALTYAKVLVLSKGPRRGEQYEEDTFRVEAL